MSSGEHWIAVKITEDRTGREERREAISGRDAVPLPSKQGRWGEI